MASQAVERPSALAGIWGECIAEFFGTMVLILFGDGCVASFALFTNLNGPTPFANEWIVIILGWGLAVMLGIYVAGAISGAHLNPAVTLALALRRAFPWAKVGPYMLAELAGAFVGGALVFFTYEGAFEAFEKAHNLTRAVGAGDFGVFSTSPSDALAAG